MGHSSSRPPRSQQDNSNARPYDHPPLPFTGPYMLRGSAGYRNNGELYGSAYNRPVYPQVSPPFVTPPANNQPPVADKQLSPTQTIRNPINVKKASLKLTPVPGAPHRLAVTFSFDASQDCMLSVFVMATETAEDGSRLTPTQQPAEPQHTYSKGLGLQYPKEGQQGVEIDTSLYDSSMRPPDASVFPLIVRGEAITEAASNEGHTLSELKPGGSQKVWMQSQTTYANVLKDDAGNWQVAVLKQKIWAMGVSYELQEIYGMEQAAAAAKEKNGIVAGRVVDNDDERMCVICLSIERDTTVLPCRHMCMCHECAQELRKQTSRCPICRNDVEALLHIRMSRQQVPKSAQTPVDQSTVSAALEKMGLGGRSSSDRADK